MPRPATDRVAGRRVRVSPGGLHHVVRPGSAEWKPECSAVGLRLLQKWRLLRSELYQLLELLKLRWYELQELLHLSQLLLLQHL